MSADADVVIAVVIPTHGRPKFLREALDSVIAQSGVRVEPIVVSDIKDPEAERICRELPGVAYLDRSGNRGGASASRNAGADYPSSAQYLAFLDDDDVWHESHLATSLATLQHSNSDFVSARIEAFDAQQRVLLEGPHRGLTAGEVATVGRGISGSSMLIRRTAFSAVGGFDENLPVKNDTDLVYRLLLSGFRFEPNPAVTVYQRKHDQGQLMGRSARRAAGIDAYRLKHYATLTSGQRRELKYQAARNRLAAATTARDRFRFTLEMATNLSKTELQQAVAGINHRKLNRIPAAEEISGRSRRYTFVSIAEEAWGAEESLKILAHTLSALDIDCQLITANQALAKTWAETIGIAHHLTRSGSGIPAAIRWSRKAMKYCERDKTVVAFSIELAVLPILYLFRKRPRLVLDLHDYLPTWSGRIKLRVLSRLFDRVIAVSQFSATQSWGAHTSVLTRPILNPSTQYARSSEGTRPTVVGLVGRLDPDKRIESVLAAMPLLPSGISLSIRGAASTPHVTYAQQLRSRTQSPRVEWTGRLPQSQVLNDLDVLVVANPEEAMGRTVLEAQLVGTVPVVPDRGGAAELVEDGVTGYVYRVEGGAAALADAILRASEAPDTMREHAREIAIQRTNPETYARSYAREAAR